MPPFLFHVKQSQKGDLMLYVTLADVKAHLRIDGTDEDALLSQYVEAAQAMAETIMHRPIYSADPADNPVTTDSSKIPPQLAQFLLVTTGDFYRNRENQQEKSFTTYFSHLLDAFICYGGGASDAS